MARNQSRYLNVVLTVIAMLLGVLVWAQLADKPLLATAAEAQSSLNDGASGIPNAAQQRDKMINSLNDMKRSVDQVRKTVESGRMKVEVTNLDSIDVKVQQ